jgi:ankyrin repeat protein
VLQGSLKTFNGMANVLHNETSMPMITEADFHEAARTGNLDIIKQAVNVHNLDVNCVENGSHETPLHKAAKNGYQTAIDFLVMKGANVTQTDSKGKTPLHHAASYGHQSVVECLLENSHSPNNNPNNSNKGSGKN